MNILWFLFVSVLWVIHMGNLSALFFTKQQRCRVLNFDCHIDICFASRRLSIFLLFRSSFICGFSNLGIVKIKKCDRKSKKFKGESQDG
jgi:hypothetical protein